MRSNRANQLSGAGPKTVRLLGDSQLLTADSWLKKKGIASREFGPTLAGLGWCGTPGPDQLGVGITNESAPRARARTQVSLFTSWSEQCQRVGPVTVYPSVGCIAN